MNQPRPDPGAVVMVADSEPAMDDAAFMDALDRGAPAPLSVYRRAYAAAGVPWPGDDEVRRRHRVTVDGTTEEPASIQLLSWPDSQ